jgi:hypothetical protein
MSLTPFLEKINNKQAVSFDETMAIIADTYRYQATEFSNGLNDNKIVNPAGSNEGSCKIFAFAQLNHLDQQQTLSLFGDFYALEVLNDPTGTSHQNIRNFIQYGWEGISFNQQALTKK